ncbi:uncharacterized protein LOC113873855 [Abrus precatorius]|uniref:Uncharacterized protein LOC113873855 n=1 Tax=Abrus precatorius TaxID=3816 RepID=A0A8B8MH09_ABRPR|nr:uncharacterized protein LOC113873855 [Abrus precatorius]
MASLNSKEMVTEIPTWIRVFSDGTVQRPRNFPIVPPSPIVPPTLDYPQSGVSSKDVIISHNPTIAARIYLPKLKHQSKVPILVYFHGGGFFFESAFSQLYHAHCKSFASQTNAIIVSVEYRLAPEHPLPACYHDCWDVLKWVASHSTKTEKESWLIQHGDFNKIFIGGDSAGANIAHNMAMRAGSEALPNGVKISGAIIVHPFFHSSSPVGSETVTGEEHLSHVVWNLVYPFAPGGVDNPLFNPVGPGAPSLAELGCSKIIVCVAGKDTLRDRGVWYYEAVETSGWQGKLELFEEKEAGHVYHLFRPESQNAYKFIKRLASFLQDANHSLSTTAMAKDIVTEMPTYIRVFSDGTVERPRQAPFAPPSLDDPQTGISSKDVVFSLNPTVSARLYLPKLTKFSHQDQRQKIPILVYCHGGRFFYESAFSQLYHNHFNTFVSQTNVIVVSVDYRLAPEHPLPACYHDCWAALQWVASHSAKNLTNAEPWLIQHGDFNRIFIGGDSAGGNIVHNIAMRAGTEALPCDAKIIGAFLSHPYFGSSYPVGSEPEVNTLNAVWNLVYPSAPGGIDNPMINPVAPGAPSLALLGCSKIIVCVAGKDMLRDRGVWYYEAVKKSGWQGELELFEEVEEQHVYHIYHPESENTTKLIKRLASFLLQ